MYHLTPIFQHRYNVLDHFYVTDIWTEIIDNCHTYCARLEKIRLDEKSWWGPKATAVPMHDFVTKAAHHGCGTCGQVSKQIFEEGWVCMNPKCEAYFLLPGLWQQPRNMAYSALFLNERTPWPQNFWLQPLRPALLTELDMVVNSRSGTELVYSKGIVCPECHGCSRRLEFLKWTCENAACNFIYKLPMRSISANEAQLGRTTDENWFDATKVKQSVQVVGSFDLREYGVPGPKGEIIGYMRHYKSNRALNGVANGPDQLFRMMQEEDFGLKRRPVRQPGSTGEIVTAHYASNWGAPYKFVVAQASTPFSQAPPVLIKALKQMTWAGKVAVADGHKEPFHDFNELLSIGYFEGNSIGYHDDGEDTLGPTIATLSLGAQAVMTLRPKAKSEVGGRNTKTQKGLKKEVIKVVLDHGDIIIMHGSELQKHYEHAVKPNGKLRYALTCRYVDPGKLPVHERAEAARLAELPLDHAQHDYRLMDVATLLKDDVARQRSARHIQAARSTLDAFRMLMQDMAPEDLAQIPEINDVAQQYRGIMGRPIFSPAPRQGLVAQGVAVQAPAAQAPAAQATRVAVQGANGQMPVAQIHIPAADAISAESDTETLIGDQQMAAGGDDQPATQL